MPDYGPESLAGLALQSAAAGFKQNVQLVFATSHSRPERSVGDCQPDRERQLIKERNEQFERVASGK
jgi:hypothetical protein